MLLAVIRGQIETEFAECRYWRRYLLQGLDGWDARGLQI